MTSDILSGRPDILSGQPLFWMQLSCLFFFLLRMGGGAHQAAAGFNKAGCCRARGGNPISKGHKFLYGDPPSTDESSTLPVAQSLARDLLSSWCLLCKQEEKGF